MEHFARWVVRHRKAVLAAAVLLLIPSVFGAAGTYINYDILTYLPPELDSMVGEGYLEDDFNMASTSMITVENMSTADTLALKSELEAVAGCKKRAVDERHPGRNYAKGKCCRPTSRNSFTAKTAPHCCWSSSKTQAPMP